MIEEDLKSNYYLFYQNRVNSKYQDYFEGRYKPLIDTLIFMEGDCIREEGMGIGSTFKALRNQGCGKMMYGFDNDDGMIELCRKNNHLVSVYKDNILLPRSNPACDIITTHGVLEHFEDQDIKDIISRYNYKKKKHIHYVPTDKYKTKSIGNERLLSIKYWLNLVKPTDYILFNDDYDLLMIKE